MALPNIQTAQYGDRVAIEKLGASRRTNNPAADVNGFTGGAGGRPSADLSDPVQLFQKMMQQRGRPNATQGQAPQYTPQEQEHSDQLDQLAEMYKDTLRLVKVASQPNAGRLTQAWAISALRDFSKAFNTIRAGTPFFDGV